MSQAIEKIIIIGGGTSGYISALAIAVATPGKSTKHPEIILIESSEIGIIGVGEASLPLIKNFNSHAGIDEKEFIEATQASFKLGIMFKNWGHKDNSYFHPFGDYGPISEGINAYQYWRKGLEIGQTAALEEYCISTQMANQGKFFPPDPNPDSPLHNFNYGFHFDAGLYARYLRSHCEKRGVKVVDGKVTKVNQNSETGFIESLMLEDGAVYDADFFIDCSGFRSLLIGETLKIPFISWKKYLPVDRAIAIPTRGLDAITPYTKATAHTAGWQWRIPLQHRTGNGMVYSSEFWDETTALETLHNNLDAPTLAAPAFIKFETGHRAKFWDKNVVCIGLSGGFLEPLESTAINFVQSAIGRFLEFYPDKDCSQILAGEFNRNVLLEYATIRDFIITHYKLNTRNGEPLWDYCRNMEIPDSVKMKHELFAERGEIIMFENDAFAPPSWISIMAGQGLVARTYNPLLNRKKDDDIALYLTNMRNEIASIIPKLPDHADFIGKYCATPDFFSNRKA